MKYNPLFSVWQSYQALQDCLEIAKVANKHPDRENLFVKANDFRLLSYIDAKKAFEEGKKESEALFVLSLWATFERFIRTYLQEKGQKLQEILPSSLANAIKLRNFIGIQTFRFGIFGLNIKHFQI